ncbi:uncharacterized protein LOC110683689 [Chenopodium quinoa]|uniref:uncharacterized protein LOC110683689 n=1 Tax=Chenopodium quinoa TaxID=63459 RepID=UPI000B79556F|nr:uncharacterized protein LOC110683689 [Chenopodium quinoa]
MAIGNKKNLLAIFAILALLVQVISAERTFEGKLQCRVIGEECGLVHHCCNGGKCSDKGTCIYDPSSSCKGVGESCGLFDDSCCDTLVCSSTFSQGKCELPEDKMQEIPHIVMGRLFNNI